MEVFSSYLFRVFSYDFPNNMTGCYDVILSLWVLQRSQYKNLF